MAEVLEIPLNSDDASFKIRTILEEIELVLRFDWNTRQAKWHIMILTSSEEPLVGCPMNINSEFLSRFKKTGLPSGKLILYDTSGGIVECGRDDLGDRCKLLYQASE